MSLYDDPFTPAPTLQVGQVAPPFIVPVAHAGEAGNAPVQTVTLSDYAKRGRWLVLCFYPGDFTFVCPTELTALSDRLDEFADLDTDVLGISTDSVYVHRAWLRVSRGENGVADLRYPLASDHTHRVARDYGILTDDGVALRGLFLVDPDGVLQYATVHNLQIGRSVDEVLRVLFALQSGGLCPSDWKPGQNLL